ncbi:D-amino-acid transaminase [Sporolactobacillus sp. THM7-7]|nr:D-amino-acid transaminase [Sporolactobacillus sp. THM7-7]
MATILYQDQLIPREQGKVDMEDRGYQFGDGIYEAIRVYGGRLFLLDLHMKRLERSARELALQLPYGIDQLTDHLKRLIKKNQIDDGLVYFQITRGASPRQHQFPENIETVLTGSATALPREEVLRPNGIKASLVDDIRWLRCDIKTLNLLGNVLAKQKALEKGSEEAIMHRGGVVTEGSSCNVFIVKDGRLVTHPADHFILNGITRLYVIDQLAPRLGIPVVEKTFSTEDLLEADEVFITSTGAEVKPVTRVEERTIASGKPGPITKRLMDAFDNEVARVKGSSALS